MFYGTAVALDMVITSIAVGDSEIVDFYDSEIPFAPESQFTGTVERIGRTGGFLHIVLRGEVDGIPQVLVLRLQDK